MFYIQAKVISASLIEEKIYCEASIDECFANDKVLLVLNKSATMSFKNYTQEDFLGVGCISVSNLTESTLEIVKQQLQAETTKDWSNLQNRIKIIC